MRRLIATIGILSLLCSFTACTPESPPIEDLTKGEQSVVEKYKDIEADEMLLSNIKQYATVDKLGDRTKTFIDVISSKKVTFKASVDYKSSDMNTLNSIFNNYQLAEGEKQLDSEENKDTDNNIILSYCRLNDKYRIDLLHKSNGAETLNLGVIYSDEITYVMNNKNKTYTKNENKQLTDEEIKEIDKEKSAELAEHGSTVDDSDNFVPDMSQYMDMFKDNKSKFKYIESRDAEYKGKTYYCESYSVEAKGVAEENKNVTFKIFFDKEVPVGVTMDYNDKEINIDILELEIEADSSKFIVPDYEEKSQSDFFIDIFGLTDIDINSDGELKEVSYQEGMFDN